MSGGGQAPLRFEDVEVGAELPAATYPLIRAHLVRYAGASGDLNPIHWSGSFAESVGLPDVIAHGMLTMATAARFVTDWCGDPGAVVEYGVRFTRPVVVPDGEGALLHVTGRVTARDEAARTATVSLTAVPVGAGGPGSPVLGKASAVVRLA